MTTMMSGVRLFSLELFGESLLGSDVFGRWLLLFTGAGFGVYLLRRYFAGGVCTSTSRLDGKTVVITGASSGIGKQTAKDLATRGARVILACRNSSSAESTAQEIVSETGNPAVIPMQLDVSRLASVRAFVDAFLNNERELHVLINNAGVFFVPESETDEGIETVFATNYLGHFLLTCLLLERLKSSGPSRVVNVSSVGYSMVEAVDWAIVLGHGTQAYSKFKAYAQSKLAMVLFTRELAARLRGEDVSVFCVHPGMVRTSMYRSFPLYTNRVLAALQWPIRAICQKTSEEGAQTVIHCAVHEGIEHHSGAFFSDCKPMEVMEFAKDASKAKELWTRSKELCGLSATESS